MNEQQVELRQQKREKVSFSSTQAAAYISVKVGRVVAFIQLKSCKHKRIVAREG